MFWWKQIYLLCIVLIRCILLHSSVFRSVLHLIKSLKQPELVQANTVLLYVQAGLVPNGSTNVHYLQWQRCLKPLKSNIWTGYNVLPNHSHFMSDKYATQLILEWRNATMTCFEWLWHPVLRLLLPFFPRGHVLCKRTSCFLCTAKKLTSIFKNCRRASPIPRDTLHAHFRPRLSDYRPNNWICYKICRASTKAHPPHEDSERDWDTLSPFNSWRGVVTHLVTGHSCFLMLFGMSSVFFFFLFWSADKLFIIKLNYFKCMYSIQCK